MPYLRMTGFRNVVDPGEPYQGELERKLFHDTGDLFGLDTLGRFSLFSFPENG
jgi:hypothetical protein